MHGRPEGERAELDGLFPRIGGNGTAADGTVYAAGESPPAEVAGPEGSAPWLWVTGHAICQVVEYGYNPGDREGQPPNSAELSWVHAHFHRMEAADSTDFWYSKGGHEPLGPAADRAEWEYITTELLAREPPSPRL